MTHPDTAQDDLTTAPFTFTEHQQRFATDVRAFADSIAPGYAERAVSEEFFWEIHREIASRGWLGVTLPRELGGMGEPAVTAGLLMENIGSADFNVGLSIFAGICNSGLLGQFATERVRDEWLPAVLSGERLVGFALTEPGAGSDARGIQTRAERTADGWRLNGSKTSSGLAAIGDASIVFARTGDGPNDISVFLVPFDARGVTPGRIPSRGGKPIGRGTVEMEDVVVPEDHLLGEIGTGFSMIAKTFDYTRSLLGLLGYGVATTALRMATDFAVERKTFGQPLYHHQGVSFVVAEELARLEAVRWLAYRALALRDAGLPHTKEAAMVKWLGPRTAFDAVREAVILHGHRGYSDLLPLQQMLLDLEGLEIGDGTPQIQKLIIAREVFGAAKRDATQQ
ncbi:acyl-CoA dehydrogenase family protein [Microbacterium suaedae]|uniref:acyl-CoA dehydrogenase family protein n=1 Tax=Microbacterium suaedae TaxID=2067813 RepID=UPI0013A66D16|nr:acyl-CoA dehydrogenase [Microbacterium suaedae]